MMEDRITLFAEVLLPVPVPGTFTYRVPYAMNNAIRSTRCGMTLGADRSWRKAADRDFQKRKK